MCIRDRHKVVPVADDVDGEGLQLLRAHLALHLHHQHLACRASHHQRLAQWAQPGLLDGQARVIAVWVKRPHLQHAKAVVSFPPPGMFWWFDLLDVELPLSVSIFKSHIPKGLQNFSALACVLFLFST